MREIWGDEEAENSKSFLYNYGDHKMCQLYQITLIVKMAPSGIDVGITNMS